MTRNYRSGSIPWTSTFKAIWKKFLVAILYTVAMSVVVLSLLIINWVFAIEAPTSNDDLGILQNFIEWFAVIYTLALSFILSQAWSIHNRINLEIDREADALCLLSLTAKMVRDFRPRQNLIRAVKLYANFPRNPRNEDKRTLLLATKMIEGIHDCVSQIVLENHTDESVKSELLRQYADLHDARNDRFDLLEQRLPLRVWVLLGVFSLAWLWGFFWLRFDSKSLMFYVSSCTIFSVTILFGYALDMNNPFAGFWRMNLSPFKDNKY